MVASKETSTNPAPLTLLWGARESVWSLYCVMTLLNGEVCVCVCVRCRGCNNFTPHLHNMVNNVAVIIIAWVDMCSHFIFWKQQGSGQQYVVTVDALMTPPDLIWFDRDRYHGSSGHLNQLLPITPSRGVNSFLERGNLVRRTSLTGKMRQKTIV